MSYATNVDSLRAAAACGRSRRWTACGAGVAGRLRQSTGRCCRPGRRRGRFFGDGQRADHAGLFVPGYVAVELILSGRRVDDDLFRCAGSDVHVDTEGIDREVVWGGALVGQVHRDVGIGWDRELFWLEKDVLCDHVDRHGRRRRGAGCGSPALGTGSGRGGIGGLTCRLGCRVAHGRDARDVLTRFFSAASATSGEHDERERSHRHHRAGAPNPVSVQLDLRIHDRDATPTPAAASASPLATPMPAHSRHADTNPKFYCVGEGVRVYG